MRSLTLLTVLFTLAPSASGCASGQGPNAPALPGASSSAPAGYIFFRRFENHAGSLFLVRGDGSNEKRILQGSRRGTLSIAKMEPPYHAQIGVSGHHPELCPSCDPSAPQKDFRLDVRTLAFEPLPQRPSGCRPVPGSELSLCIPGPVSSNRSEIVLRDARGARAKSVMEGVLRSCGHFADGSAAVVDMSTRRLYGVSPRGDVAPLAEVSEGTCKPVVSLDYDLSMAPPPDPTADPPRVIFQGAPEPGGKPGLYIASLDGKETLLITAERARFLTGLSGGAVAVELKVDAPELEDLAIIDPRRGVEPIHRWDDAHLVGLTPTGRLVISSRKPPYSLWTAQPDGTGLAEVLGDGSATSLKLATRSGYLIFYRRNSSNQWDNAALSVPETGGAPVVLARSGVSLPPFTVKDRIIVIERAANRVTMISIMPDGAGRHVLADFKGGKIFDTHVLPGGWVLFAGNESESGPGDLYVVHADGYGFRRVAGAASFYGFLPDEAPGGGKSRVARDP